MIRSAASFGFKVYYGDGSRLDVLRASGAGQAAAIAVCVDNRAATTRIAEIVKAEFTQARLLVRCFDREHAVELVGKDVDFLVRETFESAMTFGVMALRALGVPEEEANEVSAEVRRRDAERFDLDLAEGLSAGSHMLVGNLPKPSPFTTPQRAGVALNEETALITGETQRT
jgi:glutathione-regulated potassium-efflux system protein KefB